MISTLAELIAPLTPAEFSHALRTRTLVFRRGGGVNRFAGLLDWTTLVEVVAEHQIPPRYLSVTRDAASLQPIFYLEQGKVNGAKLATLMRSGASLVVQKFEAHVPALLSLCSDIQAALGEQVWATAIATSGAGGAFRTHYDTTDLIVFQLEGSKRWRICSPTVVDPIGMMPKDAVPSDQLVFDEVLQPGDFLFVPTGYWHHCENGPDLSLHGVIAFNAPTFLQAIKSLVSRLPEEEMFRARLSRLGSAEARAAHEAALKALLIEKIERMSVTDFLATDDADNLSANPDGS